MNSLRAPRLVRRLLLGAFAALLVLGVLLGSGLGHGWAQEVGQQDLEEDGREDGGDAGSDRVIDILQLSGPIDPPVVAAITDLVNEANDTGSQLVVIQLDSPGGIAVNVDDVVAAIRDSAVPVVVWVGPRDAEARGAAAFLHAASHLPALTSDATVGPACPPTVARTCSARDEALLAELALAREDAAGPGDATSEEGEPASDSPDRLATDALGADAVESFGYYVVDGLEPLLVELDGMTLTTTAGTLELDVREEAAVVRFHSLGLLRRTLHATLSPTFVYLLVVATVVLLLFEVFQPGFGVAGFAGILLLPLAVYGIVVLPVTWWALALLVAGLALLAVDLAIAGFGAVTVAGTASFAAGSWWLYASDAPLLRLSPWVVAGMTVAAVIFFVPVMTTVLRAQAGPDPEAAGVDLVGKIGIVRSVMNPEGHVFVSGALWRARWTGEDRGKIETGTRVQVHGFDGPVLLVDDPEEVVSGGPEDAPTNAAR